MESKVEEKCKELRKEFNIALSSFQEPLAGLPDQKEFVHKNEFKIYKERI